MVDADFTANLAKEFGSGNIYTALKISPTASEATAKERCQQLLAECNPHAFENQSMEQERRDLRYTLIRKASNILLKGGRDDYDRMLASKSQPSRAPHIQANRHDRSAFGRETNQVQRLPQGAPTSSRNEPPPRSQHTSQTQHPPKTQPEHASRDTGSYKQKPPPQPTQSSPIHAIPTPKGVEFATQTDGPSEGLWQRRAEARKMKNDELERELKEGRAIIAARDTTIAARDATIAQLTAEVKRITVVDGERDSTIAQLKAVEQKTAAIIAARDTTIAKLKTKAEKNATIIAQRDATIESLKTKAQEEVEEGIAIIGAQLQRIRGEPEQPAPTSPRGDADELEKLRQQVASLTDTLNVCSNHLTVHNIDPITGVHHHFVREVGAKGHIGVQQTNCLFTDPIDYAATLLRKHNRAWEKLSNERNPQVAQETMEILHPTCPGQHPPAKHVVHLNASRVKDGKKLAAEFAKMGQPKVAPLRIKRPNNTDVLEEVEEDGSKIAGTSADTAKTRSGRTASSKASPKKTSKKSKRDDERDDPEWDPDVYEMN